MRNQTVSNPASGKAVPVRLPSDRDRKKAKLKEHFVRYFWLYVFVLPVVAYYIIFSYIPMGGIVIAFKRYNGVQTIMESRWVGLKYFQDFLSTPSSVRIIKNTLVLSLYSLATFPLPIIMALFFNELRSERYKKVAQTIMYAPHFISMVVLISMMSLFFSPQYGFVNSLMQKLGMEKYSFMTEDAAFPHMYVWSGVWQSLGWGAIVYIAALSSVDPGLHEAATLDGASRIQRIIHINIPTIMPTIVIMLIMRVGQIMSVGGDKALLMRNDLNLEVSEVIGTFVYYRGLLSADYSFGAAVGLFTNIINIIMLLIANKVSEKVSETSLF